MMTMRDEKTEELTLTVYFSGTSHAINDDFCLAALLLNHTEEKGSQLKRGFSGCGITNGFGGVIFGVGLEDQCLDVQQQVLGLLKKNKKVKLNCYGHSRGAIAALILAKMLGGYDEDILEVNLAIFDTVPGNFITTAKLDLFSQTLANQNIDLSKCKNLKRVLSLYTNEPLPDTAAHAPLLPQYPRNTHVEQDVIPGCHAAAQFQTVHRQYIQFTNRQSFITFQRVREFLENCGTIFNLKRKELLVNVNGEIYGACETIIPNNIQSTLRSIYSAENTRLIPMTRACHSSRGEEIKSHVGKTYLNLHDKKLAAIEKDFKESKSDTEAAGDIALTPSMETIPSAPVYNYTFKETRDLFDRFMQEIKQGMSHDSKNSTKGDILSGFLTDMKSIETFTSKQQLKHAMRNVIALALQRDRNSLSFFSTTRSGFAVLALLRKPEYQQFTQLIQGTTAHAICYRDLRMFVLGNNDVSYFYTRMREGMYRIFKPLTEEKPSLTTNHVSRYLRRYL